VFKNAIMQKWTKVKQDNAPADISVLVDQMLKKKRTAQTENTNSSNMQSTEDRELKDRRRKDRAVAKTLKLETEAKDSYLNVDQYVYM